VSTIERNVGVSTIERNVGVSTIERNVGASTIARNVGTSTIERNVGAPTIACWLWAKCPEEQKLLIGLTKMLFHVKRISFERSAIRIEIHSNGNVVRTAVQRS